MNAVICPLCQLIGALDSVENCNPTPHKKGDSHDCLFSFGGRSGSSDCSLVRSAAPRHSDRALLPVDPRKEVLDRSVFLRQPQLRLRRLTLDLGRDRVTSSCFFRVSYAMKMNAVHEELQNLEGRFLKSASSTLSLFGME